MKLLHLDSSIAGPESVTRTLTAAMVRGWRECPGPIEIAYRDLGASPVPHLGGQHDQDGDAEAARLLQEFLDADVVLIGAPMYNFGIPSTLKAWIDRIAVAGRTFRYTADGPQGLAGGKRVVVAISSGGLHAGRPEDFVEPYLRQVFGFLGVTDIQFVRAEGVALSPIHREAALARALREVPPPRALSAAA